MNAESRIKAAAALKGAVKNALWDGLTGEEIKAIVTATLLERG